MKLIFLDIDGTLTEPGTNVPPRSAVKAIRAARAAGNKVLLCSGRNYAMLSPLLQYGFDGYIASAGGFVVCGGKVIFDCPMSDEQRDTALRILRENGVLCTVEARNGTYCDEGVAELINRVSGGNSELVRWRRALESALHIRPMSEYAGQPAYKLIVYCENESRLEPARAVLEESFSFVVQDGFSLGCVNGELINRAFDKGRGVRRVAEALGIPLSDTIGFGDSLNDLEMIETVGLGICMENGCEALKKRSGMVCPAVGDDGLAKAFRELGLA